MILLLTLLRIIPFALTGLLAWQKGYKRLSIAMAYIIVVVLINYIFKPSEQTRAFMGSVTALLLLWHSMDLPSRR